MAGQNVGSINADVRVQLDRLRGDVRQVSAELNKIASTSERVGADTEQSLSRGFDASSLAGVAAFAAVNAAALSAIRTFSDYEQSVANVAAVSGATGEELQRLQQAAQDAGETTRFTASQAADALFFLASAGLDATQSAEALNGVLQLAGATGSDLAFTSRTVTATLAQFNIEASDAARVSNVFAAANANSQATTEGLASALRQVGPIANGLNIELEDTVGALQLLFNAGFRGEAAGTALRNALGSLADETSTAVQEIEALGISFDQVDPSVVGLEGAIRTLEEAGVTTADTIRIFGREAGPQLSTLINQGADSINQYTQAVTGTNAAADQYATQNDTLAGAIDQLRSQFEAVQISLVQGVSPALEFALDVLRGFLGAVNALPGPIQGLIAVLGGGAAAIGGLNAALGVLGVTLLGPAGIVIGIGAAAAALVGLLVHVREVKDEDLAEEFGEVARSLGLAGDAARDFNRDAELIAAALGRNFDSSFESVNEQVTAMSESLGISREIIAEIGIASENLNETFKEQLETIRAQEEAERNRLMAVEEARNRALEEQALRALGLDGINAETDAERARAAAEAERLRILIQARREATATLNEELALIERRATAGVLAEEDAVNARIAAQERFQNTLTELGFDGLANERGLLDIGDRQLQDSIAERERLYEQLAAVNQASAEDAGAARGREINRVNRLTREGIEDRERRIKAAADAEIEEAERVAEQRRRLASEYLSITEDTFGSISTIIKNQAQAEVDAIDARRDAQVEALQEELQATLEAAGVREETELERLNRELEEARAAGDERTANDLENQIEREEITAEFAERQRQIEQEAARQAAQVQYNAALASWRIDRALAIANAAAAIIRTAASVPYPFNIPLTIAQGSANALQIAAINSARPAPPRLQTGGIVLPQNGGVPTVQAENGFPELSLNAGPSGQALLGMFAQQIADRIGTAGGGAPIVIQLQLDGRTVAQTTVNDYINTGRTPISPRGLRS